jgi:hypothetical protein
VIPGVGASPQLVAGSSTTTCPSMTTGTATFVYSGPVCRPFPMTSVPVWSCSGTSTE